MKYKYIDCIVIIFIIIMNQITLNSIEKNNMIFISAQPDTIYFHWQISLYIYQFAKQGILKYIRAVVGYQSKPSDFIIDLKKKYPDNIFWYKDTRENKSYIPSIRPHILSKYFKEYPEGKNVFYHDSDIFIVDLPKFELMLNDDIAYLSDTRSYISFDYLKKCSARYKTKHNELDDLDIFNKMCKIIDIDPNIVKNNQNNTGGAQYLLKNIDWQYWDRCEKKCNELHIFFNDYVKRYPINHHIQKWCVDMWVVLWEYWKMNKKTKIHKDLDFSWATGTINDYNSKKIFHLAGITNKNNKDKFHKAKYNKKNIFIEYINDPNIFNHISPKNATYEYIKILKEYVIEVYMKENNIKEFGKKKIEYINLNSRIKQRRQQNLIKINKLQNNIPKKSNKFNSNVKSFKILSNKDFGGEYSIVSKIICGKNYYKNINNKFIIFWNNNSWVITFSKYENEVGNESGGLYANKSGVPYNNQWNTNLIKISL